MRFIFDWDPRKVPVNQRLLETTRRYRELKLALR